MVTGAELTGTFTHTRTPGSFKPLPWGWAFFVFRHLPHLPFYTTASPHHHRFHALLQNKLRCTADFTLRSGLRFLKTSRWNTACLLPHHTTTCWSPLLHHCRHSYTPTALTHFLQGICCRCQATAFALPFTITSSLPFSTFHGALQVDASPQGLRALPHHTLGEQSVLSVVNHSASSPLGAMLPQDIHKTTVTF